MGEEFTTGESPMISVKLWGTGNFAKVHIIKDNTDVYTVEPGIKERRFHLEGQCGGEGKDQLLLCTRRAGQR